MARKLLGYAVAITAYNNKNHNVTTVASFSAEAKAKKSAIVIGLSRAYEQFPREDSWIEHQCSVLRVEIEENGTIHTVNG